MNSLLAHLVFILVFSFPFLASSFFFRIRVLERGWVWGSVWTKNEKRSSWPVNAKRPWLVSQLEKEIWGARQRKADSQVRWLIASYIHFLHKTWKNKEERATDASCVCPKPRAGRPLIRCAILRNPDGKWLAGVGDGLTNICTNRLTAGKSSHYTRILAPRFNKSRHKCWRGSHCLS